MLCIRCVLIITSCCSTGSERPHRRCHLANNGGSRRIFSILHDGPGPVPQDWPFPWAGLSPTTWFLGPIRVHTPNGISIDWFSTAYGYVQQTHTQTDHGTSITIAPNSHRQADTTKPHLCTLCMRCGLIIISDKNLQQRLTSPLTSMQWVRVLFECSFTSHATQNRSIQNNL